MHSFEVHSNESACRKSGRLGLEQVNNGLAQTRVNVLLSTSCAEVIDLCMFCRSLFSRGVSTLFGSVSRKMG